MSTPAETPQPAANPYTLPPSASTASGRPADSIPKMSALAVVSFALGAFFMLGFALFRILNPLITYGVPSNEGLATGIGIFGLLTILPVILVVVFGHIALTQTKALRRRGRGLAGAGVSLGYALVLLYLVTIITAAIATSFPHNGPFIENVFYWV